MLRKGPFFIEGEYAKYSVEIPPKGLISSYVIIDEKILNIVIKKGAKLIEIPIENIESIEKIDTQKRGIIYIKILTKYEKVFYIAFISEDLRVNINLHNEFYSVLSRTINQLKKNKKI